jgi:hypothetical protein
MMFQGYPESKRAGRCRSCGRAIVWVRLAESETEHPFNPPLTVIGEQPSLFDGTSRADFVAVSHFATCPHAPLHRR